MGASVLMLILTIHICTSLVSSVNTTECEYIYVKPDSFAYHGWFHHVANDKKFGHSYWSQLSHPNIIQLLIYQNQWYFYNWDNKDESYILESNDNEQQLPISSVSTWDFIKDGSSIELQLICSSKLNPSIGTVPTIKTTLFPINEEQIEWLINKENCNSKAHGYFGFISDENDQTLSDTFWDIPILSNHSSNITISISGNSNDNKFTLGQHKITYAAEDQRYFIMCQITIYVIGMFLTIDFLS